MSHSYNVNLALHEFMRLQRRDYVIIEDNGYNADDYILFRKYEAVGNIDLHDSIIARIDTIVRDEKGIKDGFVLLELTKL